ncbi:hypothetical protein [Sphingomonas xinjiangensis]|uniref:Tetratricopeptide repeat protein n=1 Tax=Sphingomonas xinjiangensis TaxID=643568 RepID=A0A840YMF9_9SPHN|nr:hypothetical protein [Sphingomonas xinjiangensis]MBB5710780.1 hypothetical protein [Sphingomonas xinjiangensis]
MRTALLALSASAASVAPAPVGGLPPFAAELAEAPPITGGAGWHGPVGDQAWNLLATAAPSKRQAARWSFALGLLAKERGAEAIGVLDVMAKSDEDLKLVLPYQLARGVALTLLGRNIEAVEAMGNPDLAGNPEACAWRLRALAANGSAAAAVGQINCALPAINGRTPNDRAPFVLAAARAAIDTGQPQPALAWLKLFSEQNPDANLLRGRALVAAGELDSGKLSLERAKRSGSPEVQAEADLALTQSQFAAHKINAATAQKQLDGLRYRWRGGQVEEQALRLSFKLAGDANDLGGQLRAGATLFRYYKLGKEAAPMLATVQRQMAAILAPGSGVPLADAAGLYWDYRELAPGGAEGDLLVLHLADRLQEGGLYGRAAELLQYQLTQRAQDVAQGPLSVKVASLQILAGRPDRALKILQETEQPSYTEGMRQDRKRMEAVALHKLGRDAAAMAALEGVPGGASVKAELHWRAKDWGGFVTENEAALPAPQGMNQPQQAAVLRQAVALGMIGDEARLQKLRARYFGAFKPLPSGQAFDVLTGKLSNIDPATLSAAMGAIPDASPAGSLADLLDAAT